MTAAIALMLAMSGPSANAAQGPSLGAAASFAVLSAAPGGLGAVTCTASTITGNVGSTGALTNTGCVMTVAPVTQGVVDGFNSAYLALTPPSTGNRCAGGTTLTGTLARTLTIPGLYCFDAGVTTSDGTLFLGGPADGVWLFKIGILGTGALTGTNFNVVMSGLGSPCNVTWWVRDGATMTTSQFKGTILAGAAITVTGPGTFHGRALAKAGVTIETGTRLTGCTGGSLGGGNGNGNGGKCNDNDDDNDHDNNKDHGDNGNDD
ncbi:MAG: ice-binding family protein [Chloroflexota bacterium]|nr:ice-binding family protein [Chloroflexota bacterium]